MYIFRLLHYIHEIIIIQDTYAAYSNGISADGLYDIVYDYHNIISRNIWQFGGHGHNRQINIRQSTFAF